MASLTIVTRPTAILTTAAAREQCRIDDTFENDLLDAYIAAAQREAELILGRPVGQTVYRLALDQFPDDDEPILIPRPPLVSVDSIAYDDADGNAATLDVNTDVQVDAWGEPGRIVPAVSTRWPDTQTDKINCVRIQFTAGSNDADEVGQEVIQALRLAVAGWYENREDVTEGSLSTLPNGFGRLLRLNCFRDRDLDRFLADH